MRRLYTQLAIFAMFAGWDWLATAGIRYTANESLWAVPMASLYTAFWYFGVSTVASGKARAVTVIVAAAVGTAGGVLWP